MSCVVQLLGCVVSLFVRMCVYICIDIELQCVAMTCKEICVAAIGMCRVSLCEDVCVYICINIELQ